MGDSWPSRAAAQILRKLSGADISPEELRLQTNRQETLRAASQQAEVEREAIEQAAVMSEYKLAAQPMLVGLDGSWICSRERRGGMEGKVAEVCSQMEAISMPMSCASFSWNHRSQARRASKQGHCLEKKWYAAPFSCSKQVGKLATAAAHRCDKTPVNLSGDR